MTVKALALPERSVLIVCRCAPKLGNICGGLFLFGCLVRRAGLPKELLRRRLRTEDSPCGF
jgi:hypothetical protein